MIVVHFAKVSALYPRVVISLLAKRLEKRPFCQSYTSFCAWPRDHYMSLQRFTIGRMPSFGQSNTQYHSIAKVSQGSYGTTAPLALCEPERVTTPNSHSSELCTLHIASLINKQAIPYRTRGDTCCPGVSTPKT
jgi:hypothetical protein